MRNAIIAVVIVSTGLISISNAQPLSKTLTVEVNGQIYGTSSGWITSQTDNGQGWASSGSLGYSTYWKGYYGGLPVDEERFYRVAGYNYIADSIKAHFRMPLADRWGFGCLGSFLTIAGAIGGVYCISEAAAVKANPDDIVDPQGQYTSDMCAGIVCFLLGAAGIPILIVPMVHFEYPHSYNLTPSKFAVGVAIEYNKKVK
jgi:hypothetical protein